MKVQRSPIFYIDRNYFKGKILVFYKLKTMITGDD